MESFSLMVLKVQLLEWIALLDLAPGTAKNFQDYCAPMLIKHLCCWLNFITSILLLGGFEGFTISHSLNFIALLNALREGWGVHKDIGFFHGYIK